MVAVNRLLVDNRRLLGKLVVVAALMFGFGYALVPMYRAICDALGVNVLSVSEQRVAGGYWGARKAVNTQVDLSRTITVEFDANARGPWDFKPALRSLQVRIQEHPEPHHGGAGHPQLRAHAGQRALQQAGMFLFQRIHTCARRSQELARGVCDRPQVAQGRNHDHLVLHLL
jgi:hypothetical protein